jgi:uncharacterized membrane protein YfcA
MSLVTALLVVLAGAAVGATSIGGILVVPALTGTAGMGITPAIAASNFSFLFTGTAGLALWRAQARAGSTARFAALPLAASALAGAAVGALTLALLPPALLRLGVAALAFTSGSLTLSGAAPSRADGEDLRFAGGLLPWVLGFAVGCASAWSGTGGPAVLLPVLLLMRAPTLTLLAMSHAIQLPIALAATAVNVSAGHLDLMLGLQLGVLLMLGWWAGLRASRHLPVATLRRLLACGLIAVGLWYAWQTLQG